MAHLCFSLRKNLLLLEFSKGFCGVLEVLLSERQSMIYVLWYSLALLKDLQDTILNTCEVLEKALQSTLTFLGLHCFFFFSLNSSGFDFELIIFLIFGDFYKKKQE